MSDNITINKIELASELAHERAQTELDIIDSSEMYDTDEHGTRYKEWVQDHFNRWYDYYLTKIEEVGNDNT
jgi:hypothetical protein